MCMGGKSSTPNYGTPAPQTPTTFKPIDPAVEYSQQQKVAQASAQGTTQPQSFGSELGSSGTSTTQENV